MKIIENNIIPRPGFLAINLFGVCFVRKNSWRKKTEERKKVVINHESIHTAQMRELWYIFFYLLYGLEWIGRVFVNGPSKAYDNLSFEKEAYDNEKDFEYLSNRRHFAQWRKK